MSRVEFPSDWIHEIASQREVKAIEQQAAMEALGFARSYASSFVDTGAFMASLKAENGKLFTTDPAGHIIDRGSVKTQPYNVLRRAAEATGATVEEH